MQHVLVVIAMGQQAEEAAAVGLAGKVLGKGAQQGHPYADDAVGSNTGHQPRLKLGILPVAQGKEAGI